MFDEDGLRRPRRGRRWPSEARPVGRIHGGGSAVAGVAGVRVAGAVLDHSDPLHGGSGLCKEA